MPGEYENTGGAAVGATILTVLDGQGGPIVLANQVGFHDVPMGAHAGGAVAGAGYPGVTNGSRSDCVVIAVLERNGGQFTRFYFTHLNGGVWSPANQHLFNQSITTPANAWVAMSSNAFSGMTILLEQMNAGNPNGAIPEANLLRYKTPGATFGTRFADGAIGERP